MKLNLFSLSLITFMLVSCKQSNNELANDYIESANLVDQNELKNLLNENFLFLDKTKDTLIGKDEFLKLRKFATERRVKVVMKDLVNLDSLVRLTVAYKLPLDSLLELSNEPQYFEELRFSNGKIDRLTRDTMLNGEAYHNERELKLNGVMLFLEDEGLNDVKKSVFDNLFIHIDKFNKLSKDERDEYYKSSSLIGSFYCEKGLYRKIEFKGKSTCVVYDGLIGFPFATSFVIDGRFIRIKTDKSDLLLKIIDNNTLEGEGWATGKYKKLSN